MTETIESAKEAASTLFLGQNGEFWDFWLIMSVLAAAIVAGAVGVTTIGSITAHSREADAAEKALAKYKVETTALIAEADEGAKKASEHAAQLAVELEQAKNSAKQIDANLLREQRLTSAERWRLERIERAVLPRSAFVNWELLVEKLKALQISDITIAEYDDGRMETGNFVTNFLLSFQRAGIKAQLFRISEEDLKFFGQSSSGLSTIAIDPKGVSLANVLWTDFQIGGASSSEFPDRRPDIPKNLNCLVIGPNNWAMAPSSGQAGEGLDQYGRPVPP